MKTKMRYAVGLTAREAKEFYEYNCEQDPTAFAWRFVNAANAWEAIEGTPTFAEADNYAVQQTRETPQEAAASAIAAELGKTPVTIPKVMYDLFVEVFTYAEQAGVLELYEGCKALNELQKALIATEEFREAFPDVIPACKYGVVEEEEED
jgi:hypothetical protein